MIALGALAYHSRPIKTTLLLYFVAVANQPTPQAPYQTGVITDISGRGHVFTTNSYGFWPTNSGSFARSIGFGDVSFFAPEFFEDGLQYTNRSVVQQNYTTPNKSDAGPQFSSYAYYDSNMDGVADYPTYASQLDQFYQTFPRLPRDYFTGDQAILEGQVRYVNHTGDVPNGSGGTDHSEDKTYYWHQIDYWKTVPYQRDPFYLGVDVTVARRGSMYAQTEIHDDFDWSDGKNFRIKLEIEPNYDVYTTYTQSQSNPWQQTHTSPSGIILQNGAFDNAFTLSYQSSNNDSGDPDAGNYASLTVQFGSNILVITEQDIYPQRFLRNGYKTPIRIDRIDGIAYIYIRGVFVNSMPANGVAKSFDVKVVEVTTLPYEYTTDGVKMEDVYLNNVLVPKNGEPISRARPGTPSIPTFDVTYPQPCNRITMFAQIGGQFGGKLSNLQIFSIDD